jgi:hypothetical protein
MAMLVAPAQAGAPGQKGTGANPRWDPGLRRGDGERR